MKYNNFIDMTDNNIDNLNYNSVVFENHIRKTINSSKELYNLCNDISETQLIDFNTRFQYIFESKNDLFVEEEKTSIPDIQSYFGKRSKPKMNPLGQISEDKCWILDQESNNIGKISGKITMYHYYNTPAIFAGTFDEIIIQLPTQLSKSDKSFYYLYSLDGFDNDLNLHKTNFVFYEKLF